MLIKLFDIEQNIVKPTEHCYTIGWLKDIMDIYPDDYIKIYTYLFYMTCPNAELNPFFNIRESDKEDTIYSSIRGEFPLEDPTIMYALEQCRKLYETAGYRAFLGMKEMLDKLAIYLKDTPISHGRDGNMNSLLTAGVKFIQIKQSFDKVYEDLKNEQQVRGGKDLGYDQKGNKGLSEDDLFKDEDKNDEPE